MTNHKCSEKDYYDTSMMYKKDPNLTGVRMLKQCNDTFKFKKDPKLDCPVHNYLNYGCLNNLGKDLLNNEYLVPPLPDTPEQLAIRESIARQWRDSVSLEGCTINRNNNWTPSSKFD